ncbi:MAG: hypothetical protein K8T10_09250 [Candidatus Eremiobacteraeota bacterium]|nr:hypothetical protein [Candidatus Eremiobacteraeota bacterium]
MRFIQKGENKLEIHNQKFSIPIPMAGLGFAFFLIGLVSFFLGGLVLKVIAAMLCIAGIVIIMYVYIKISSYKFYVFTCPDEHLWEMNFIGTHKVQLESGMISSIEVEVSAGEDLDAQYKVRIVYSSGKSYAMELTKDKDQAKAIADIFAIFFDKSITMIVPELPKRELGVEHFEDPLHRRMRNQYPKGMPRKDAPHVDFVIPEKARYRDLIKFRFPPFSILYDISLYFFIITILIFLTVTLVNPKYLLYGLGTTILGAVVFFVGRSLESGNLEEIAITPDEIRYHRHHTTAEIKRNIPLEEVKMVHIIQASGCKVHRLNLSQKKDEMLTKPREGKGGTELYLLTDQGIIGIETWMNKDMADYISYLIGKSTYVMSQKKRK